MLDLKRAPRKAAESLLANPTKDMVMTCACIEIDMFEPEQIASLHRALRDKGSFASYKKGDFEWGLSPYELPFSLFIETIVRKMFWIRRRNPVWKFVIGMDVPDEFCRVVEAAYGEDLDFGSVMYMLDRCPWRIEDWQEEALVRVLELQESLWARGRMRCSDCAARASGKDKGMNTVSRDVLAVFAPWDSCGDPPDPLLHFLLNMGGKMSLRK